MNFTPKYLSRRELRGAGLANLFNLFQSMLLPSRPRPMTSQVKIKDSFGVCKELYAPFEIAEFRVNKQVFHLQM